MESAAGDWFALLGLVFMLGLRHGLDADHLATIDGLTRFNAPRRRRWLGGAVRPTAAITGVCEADVRVDRDASALCVQQPAPFRFGNGITKLVCGI